MLPSRCLNELPKELLRAISGHLPCQSALDFLLTCRHMYLVCDDWTVWRTLAVRNVLSPHGIGMLSNGKQDGWKRCVIAAAKAARPPVEWALKDMETWIPHLAALCHPDILHDSALSGGLPSCSMFDHPIVLQDSEDLISCSSNISEQTDLPAMQTAQAASFSLAVQCLSLSAPRECFVDLLRAVPWVEINMLELDDMTTEERTKAISLQHALANRVVGFMAATMRFTRGISHPFPPFADSIPFTRQMDLPLPFDLQGMEQFATCHLRVMAKPSFFTDSTWTGCLCIVPPADLRTSPGALNFLSIGGTSMNGRVHGDTVIATPVGHYPNGNIFEAVARFQLVDEQNEDYYTLQSNNFHSEAMFHRVRLTVNRRTGWLSVHHWHPLRQDFMTTGGVITPFGIVTWLNSPGAWMWLWKVDWCGSRPVS
ncbi:hypothetical protein FB567DRAFT_220549 [Paraphoma chrysanthemicola]|uniref:F-box domain-containing protein n=1 Tax=Paraphoma chrysanthemicola TaxID=798071 RepID=A0A8K0QTT6_9PLEO|nr:hypothetical protein FB567DRAFT_220549 [Paraphoma chrysanthemicola]